MSYFPADLMDFMFQLSSHGFTVVWASSCLTGDAHTQRLFLSQTPNKDAQYMLAWLYTWTTLHRARQTENVEMP